jgi:hypothetical protein
MKSGIVPGSTAEAPGVTHAMPSGRSIFCLIKRTKKEWEIIDKKQDMNSLLALA